MTFIDPLTLVLDLLILVACAVFYTGFLVWLNMRDKQLARAQAQLMGGATILGILGGVILIIALWGATTWPLSVVIDGNNVLGSYDILFFDALVMFGIVLVAFALAVHTGRPTSFVGVLGVVAGFGIMYYGYRAYLLSLTLEPLYTFLLYLAFGATAVLSFPVTLYLDWFVTGLSKKENQPYHSEDKPAYPWMWNLWIGAFLVVVVCAGVAGVYYGFTAAWAHLASPP